MNGPDLVGSWLLYLRDAEFGNSNLDVMVIIIGGTFDHKISKGLLNSDSGNRMCFFTKTYLVEWFLSCLTSVGFNFIFCLKIREK